MSVPAFTNSVGDFTKYDSIIGTSEGTYLGKPYYTTDYNQSLLTGSVHKDKTVRGDHRSDYPYRRSVYAVIANEPALIRYDNKQTKPENRVNYVSRRHLSRDSSPASFPHESDLTQRMANVAAQARTKNRLKLGNGRASLGVDLAEARESVRMMADTSSVLLRTMLAFARRDFGSIPGILERAGYRGGSLRTLSKVSASSWLSYGYGWRPLMKSLTSNYAAFGVSMDTKVMAMATSHTTRVSFDRETDNGTVREMYRYTGRVKSATRASVNVDSLRQLSRVGLVNPASIGWEIIPYSFVVDWFIPIGNVLEACTATMGLNFIGGYESTVTEIFKIAQRSGASGFQSVEQRGFQKSGRLNFTRAPYNNFPLPGAYYRDRPLSTPNLITAVALMRQLYR